MLPRRDGVPGEGGAERTPTRKESRRRREVAARREREIALYKEKAQARRGQRERDEGGQGDDVYVAAAAGPAHPALAAAFGAGTTPV